MDQSNTPGDRKPPRESRMGQSRTPMHLVFQASIGVILGIGLASILELPAAQLALVGVAISIAAWVVEHGISFASRSLRTQGLIRLVLKLVALIGFTVSVSALLTLV